MSLKFTHGGWEAEFSGGQAPHRLRGHLSRIRLHAILYWNEAGYLFRGTREELDILQAMEVERVDELGEALGEPAHGGITLEEVAHLETFGKGLQ